jgi:hypothetical protein
VKTQIQRIVQLALTCLAVAALFGPELALAQDLHPSRRASPMGMARATLDDGAYVRVSYGRPYLRGRSEIFGAGEGALVPYGQVWRTGANEATEITVTDDVMVGGQKLPAGTYSLFTTPGESEWKIHFNSRLELWGTMGRNAEGQFTSMYSADEDVVTVSVPAGKVEGDEPVDQFTIAFDDVDGPGVHMVISWAGTSVRVPVTPAG